mgnify:FL=1
MTKTAAGICDVAKYWIAMPFNPQPADLEAPADGRRERTGTTRNLILETGRRLIIEGNGEPTAKEIAEQVGITTRTLFRHFPDMGTLLITIMEQAQARAKGVMDEPFPSEFSPSKHWQKLLHIVVERRTRMYEFILPLHISPTIQRHWRTQKRVVISKGVQRRRKRLQEILPKKLTSNTIVFEALDATLSIELWISLRVDQGLSVAKATKVLHYSVDCLVSQPA